MVIRNVESYALPQGGFEVGRGMPPQDVLEERLRFVKDMRWLPEDLVDDIDRYDLSDDTMHFTRRSSSGLMMASMRLTPVENVEESLSYEMLAANPEFQKAVLGSDIGARGDGVWDLTRLVFPINSSDDAHITHGAILELFGMAAFESVGDIDYPAKNASWIYSTTPWMQRFLRGTGIESQVIAEGRLPDAVNQKLQTTFFCAVDVTTLRALRASDVHRDTYESLLIGAHEARSIRDRA